MRTRRAPISIGAKFGRLTTVQCIPSVERSGQKWVCICDCGQERIVRRSGLLSGDNQSCGCLSRDNTVARFTKHGQAGGGKPTKEYRVWSGMRARCRDPNYPGYHNYGGRGIKVCERWNESFDNFFSDMGEAPSKSHSLDRIDNDGNYEPENCRWATRKQQSRNTRQVVVVTYQGEPIKLPDLVERLNLDLRKVRQRLWHGWSLERALS